MTYAFKLAKRIARNRSAALLVVLAVYGCAADQVASVQQPTDFKSRTAADSLATSNGPAAGQFSRVSAAAVTTLFMEGFEDNNLGSRYWYDNKPMTTSSMERVVGSRSLEARFNAGSANASWGVARRQFTPSSSVYLSYWVKYSSNWQGSANGSQPHEFSLLTNEDSKWAAPGSTRLTFSMQHSAAATALTPLFTWHDRVNIDQSRVGQNLVGLTEQRAVSGCNGDLARPAVSVTCYSTGSRYANLTSLLAGPAALRRNVWQHVEVFVQLNTVQNGIGQANGILRYWVDGALIVDRNDLLLRTGARPNMKFAQLFLAPYLPSAAPATQFVWYDDLRVTTGPADEESLPPPPPPVAVASVAVAPTSLIIHVGQTGQIVATPRDASGNALSGRVVTWSSSAPGVASVNASGLVTGVDAGAAIITATSEGRSALASVTVETVTVPVASVAVSPANLSLQVGQTGQIAATPRDASGNALPGRVVTWSSSAPTIAAVNANGLVSGVAAGNATITATSEGRSAAASVTVAAVAVPVASVAVSPASLYLQIGQTGQIAATPRDAAGNSLSGRVVTWSSSAPGVATVNASGLVTGVAVGSATITATSEGRSAAASITVGQVPVASVAMSPASLSLQVAQTGQFTATPRDAAGNALTGRAIVWSSTAPLIASVNSSGQVTALLVGTATIRATSEGKIGSATVTVGLVPVASVLVSPTSLNLQAGQSAQVTATLRDALGLLLTGRVVSWTTSSAGVATVSSSGLVTAQGSGTATISASSEGRVGTVAVAVSAALPPPTGGGYLAEPVYTASNPNHKLHVHETWGSLTGISNLYSQPRSDGGLAWVKHGGTASGTKYLTLVNQGDGFGSVRHISIDFTSDPPIAPHGIVGPYTAVHAGFHWANGGGDDNVRAEAGISSGGGASSLTDASKNWPANYWVGHGAYISSGPGAGVQLTVVSNTATTLTVAGSWGAAAGSNYSIGASGTQRSWIRGLDLGRWSNKPANDAVVVEWAIRQRGTNWYEGKNVDMGAGQTGGTGRWLFDHFSDPLGVGGTYTCTDLLCRLYYSNSGATGLFPNMPPTSKTTAPAIHRSAGSQLTSAAGSSFVVYKQNRAYGTGPGQFIWGSQFGVGPQNANLAGTSTPMYQAGWLYNKIRITREPRGAGYAYGRGRLEMWIGPSPGSLTKVMEYLGDIGQLAAGKVWVAPTDAMAMPDALEIINFFAPTARMYKGGAIVDLGTVRVWSHSRQ